MTPAVSLCLPVFNGARYLESTVRSLLAQDFADIELIITDNASTDATRDICEAAALRDKRVRYVRHERNIGAAPNYNSGAALARGKYIKWCAHDDEISPNFISATSRVLDARPEVTLAFGLTVGIDPEGVRLGVIPGEMGSIDDDDPAVRFVRSIREAATCFPIFGLFRAETLRRSSGHRFYYGSDRALLAEIALLGRCVRVDEAVFFNREHPSRSINIPDLAERSRWQTGRRSRRAAMEHINLALHLVEIARRHPDVVAPHRALAALSTHLLSPRQIGRYGLDVIRFLSPRLATSLKRTLLPAQRLASQGEASAA